MSPTDPNAPLTRLFVYGTLKPCEPRWPALRPYVQDDPRPATTIGRLWDTRRGWPAMTTGDGTTNGFVVELQPDLVDEALRVLDDIEGVGSGLFQRRRIAASGVECWAYLWPHAIGGMAEVDGTWSPGD